MARGEKSAGLRLRPDGGQIPMESYQPLHRHADARLIVFTKGVYAERAFDRTATFAPGDFVIRPNHFAHDGDPRAGASYVRLRLSPRAARNYFSAYGWTARRGRVPACALAELAIDPAGGDAVIARAATTALERAAPASRLDKIAAALQGVGSAPLADLAEAHGFRPWELARAFRRAFAISPTRYRQEARVQAALKLMAETAAPLAAIAADAGFADQSHLCRLLRRATGVTPADARRAVQLC